MTTLSIEEINKLQEQNEKNIKDKILFQDAIKTFGECEQIVVAMEEMSELIKELSKTLRLKINIKNVSEEIADVEIMLEQMKLIFNNQELVNMYLNFKKERLAGLIAEKQRG